MPSDFEQFDEQLRRVAPPPGLCDRLREIPNWNDSDLDAELAAVELPTGLLARLHGIVADEQLDQAIRQVPVTPANLERMKRIAKRPDPAWLRQRAVSWAIAASLIFLVWGGFVSGSVALMSHSVPTAITENVVWIDHAPVDLDLRQNDDAVLMPAPPLIEFDPQLIVRSEYEPETTEPDSPEFYSVSTTTPLAELENLLALESSVMWRQQFDLSWAWLREHSPPPADRPAWDLAAIAPASTSPSLWATNAPQPHLFTIDNSPVFSPQDQRLENSQPKLSQRTTTFDWAAAQVATGRFPAGESLHVSDFLAAMDYNSLNAGPGKVAWEVNSAVLPGGVVHRGVRPLVLQVGVQAGEMPRADERPREMLLAIDTSASMSAGRLEATRVALERFLERLKPSDRAAVVSFNETEVTTSRWFAQRERGPWNQAVAGLSASGAGDFGGGLMASVEQIMQRAEFATDADRRLVILTDTEWEFAPSQFEALGRVVEELSRRGVELHIVHLGPTGESRRQLTALAESTGGRCVAAGASYEIGRAFGSTLLGGEAMLATDVEFIVRFDPKQVAAYRLLGDHAPSILAGDADQSVSLAAGEGLTALYEVWLKPEASGNPITVEASWRNALTQKQESRRRSLAVADLVTSSAEVPDSLWLASLAVAAVDSLRRPASEAEVTSRLERILAVAREDRPSLAKRADVRRIIRLLENSKELVGND